MIQHDELSVRRAARQGIPASLRDEILGDPRPLREDELQRRLESAIRGRTAARELVGVLEQRAGQGDTAAAEALPAAIDRALAADDRVMAAVDRRAAAEFLQRSHRDHLSGALQRSAGEQQLERELERSHRDGVPLVAAFVDVDGLKQVNDRHGHLAGDAVIRAAGAALAAHVRSYDVLFRFGGDEFVCALTGVLAEDAEARFRAAAETLDRLSPGTTFTVGLTLARPDDSVARLLGRADAELYDRKARRPRTVDLRTARERGWQQ